MIPLLAWMAYGFDLPNQGIYFQIITVVLLFGSVLAAVYHSETIAHKVGEPFGAIILAIAITIIEVALIISLMISGGEKAIFLARDTVFAAVMILLNGIIGICLLVGASKHFEQFFEMKSINTAMVSLVTIIVLTLVLPNFTTTLDAPKYTTPQLFFVAISCLIVYGTFLWVQTGRHQDYFVLEENESQPKAEKTPSNHSIYVSLMFLLIGLGIVVLLAKSLSPLIETAVEDANLPQSLVGIIIATVVLLPEGLAAVNAAYKKNDIQISLNLALGSALAAIGLTIPSVAIVSYIYDIDIVLGLDRKSILLLALSIFIVVLSLSKGKTNLLYGVVLLVIFVTYIFTTIFP